MFCNATIGGERGGEKQRGRETEGERQGERERKRMCFNKERERDIAPDATIPFLLYRTDRQTDLDRQTDGRQTDGQMDRQSLILKYKKEHMSNKYSYGY